MDTVVFIRKSGRTEGTPLSLHYLMFMATPCYLWKVSHVISTVPCPCCVRASPHGSKFRHGSVMHCILRYHSHIHGTHVLTAQSIHFFSVILHAVRVHTIHTIIMNVDLLISLVEVRPVL